MKKELFKFELALIGVSAIAGAIEGAKFSYSTAISYDLNLSAAIVCAVTGFFVFSWLSAVTTEAFSIPISVWVGKLFSRAEMKEKQ